MRSQVLLAVTCLASLLLGAWLALKLRELRERMHGRALQRQGARGERDAERLLRAHGYTVRQRQARRSYAVHVDGARRNAEVCFDFVVERAGEVLVAEVKTGSSAPRIDRAETRRQLLEYQLATGGRCVLLVDPDAGTISEVAFAITMPASMPRGSWWTSAWLVAAVLAAAWYVQHVR